MFSCQMRLRRFEHKESAVALAEIRWNMNKLKIFHIFVVYIRCDSKHRWLPGIWL